MYLLTSSVNLLVYVITYITTCVNLVALAEHLNNFTYFMQYKISTHTKPDKFCE